MRIYFIILFLLITTLAGATNYYVKNGGSDVASGLDDANAWETLSKVSGATFAADDTIFLKRDDIWRESLTIHNSGTSGHPIVYTSYGTGDKALIIGSVAGSGWDNYSGNVWVSTNTFNDPYSGSDGNAYFVELDETVTWGRAKKAAIINLAVEYDWTWVANYIYVYAATDPDTRYSSVEVGQIDQGIILNGKEYITIDSLEIRYFKGKGIMGSYPVTHLHGLNVKNCKIGWIGIKGSSNAYGIYFHYSDSKISYDTIHDCGRRSISIPLGDGTAIRVENDTIEHCYFYNGFHTTGVDCSVDEGYVLAKLLIRNNKIYDDPNRTIDGVEYINTMGIWLQEYSGTGYIDSVYIYNNLFLNSSFRGIGLESVTGVYIWNNTFYGVNLAQTAFGAFIYAVIGESGVTTIKELKNNIFYNNAALTPAVDCYSMRRDATSVITSCNYNLWYHTVVGHNMFYIGSTTYHTDDYVAYKTATGYDANSPAPANPTFTGAPGDLTLVVGSPAIAAGIGVGLITDYAGEYWKAVPSIGAYEYDSDPPTPPPTPPEITTDFIYGWKTGVKCGGSGIDDGGGTITAKGVVYSTSANPTTADDLISGGTGTLDFWVRIIDLNPVTTYHIRAYCTNAEATSYGADYEFTTSAKSYVHGSSGKIIHGSSGKIVIDD